MSILLESLNQSSDPVSDSASGTSAKSQVPSVDDSHFDDEMLSDEWLIQKLKFWKIASLALLVGLLSSWIAFYIYANSHLKALEKSNLTIEQLLIKEQNEISHVENQPLDNSQPQSVFVKKSVPEEKIEPVYQPKKMEQPISTRKENSEKLVRLGVLGSETVNSNSVNNGSRTSDQPTNFESLPESLIAEMPDFEINSYVVSSNEKKSFVVLNGSFYGVGETIAPYLVLISINNDDIIVKYKNQLIRKKYN